MTVKNVHKYLTLPLSTHRQTAPDKPNLPILENYLGQLLFGPFP